MLDLMYLRENLETARVRLSHRGYALDVETFQRLDGERKQLIQEVEGFRQKLNTGSAEIGRLKRENVDTASFQADMTAISEQIKAIEVRLKKVEDQLSDMVG